MNAVAIRKKAADIIDRLEESDLQLVVSYANLLYAKKYKEAEQKKELMELFGSVQDDSFVRPEQSPLEKRNWL